MTLVDLDAPVSEEALPSASVAVTPEQAAQQQFDIELFALVERIIVGCKCTSRQQALELIQNLGTHANQLTQRCAQLRATLALELQRPIS